jgi:hypothetical protein
LCAVLWSPCMLHDLPIITSLVSSL